ncbi:hypothetical protein ACHAXN_002637 [Cyclotella atomus]
MADKIKNVTFLVDMMKYKTSSASREFVDPLLPQPEERDPSETKMSFYDHHEYARAFERRQDPPGELNTYSDSYEYDRKDAYYCSSQGYYSYARTFVRVPVGYCAQGYPVYSESGSVYSHGLQPTTSDASQATPLVHHGSSTGPAAAVVDPTKVDGRRPSPHRKSQGTYYNCQQTFYENFKQNHQRILERLNCALEPVEENDDETEELGHWMKSSLFCQLHSTPSEERRQKHLINAIGDMSREKSQLEQELRTRLEEIKRQRQSMEEQFLNEIKKEHVEKVVLESQLQTKLFDRMEKRVMMEMDMQSDVDVVEMNRLATRTPRVKMSSKPPRLPIGDRAAEVESGSFSTAGSPTTKVVGFKKNKSALRGDFRKPSPKAYRLLLVTMSQPGTLGLEIEVGNGVTSAARVARVLPGSQGYRAGVKGGDVLCHADSDVEFSYHEFLRLAQSGVRPLMFNVRRVESALSVKECPLAEREGQSQVVSERDGMDRPETVFSSDNETEDENQDRQAASPESDIEALNQCQHAKESKSTEESVPQSLKEAQIKSLSTTMPEAVTEKDLNVLVNNIEKYISENAARVLAKIEAEEEADAVEEVDGDKKIKLVQEDNSEHKTSLNSAFPPPLFDEKELSKLVNGLVEQPKQLSNVGSKDNGKVDIEDDSCVEVSKEGEPRRPLEKNVCSSNQVKVQCLDRDAANTVSESDSKENAEKRRQEEVKAALETLNSLGYTRGKVIMTAKANLAKTDTSSHLKPSLVLLPNKAQDNTIVPTVAEQKGRKIRVEVVKASRRRKVNEVAVGKKADLAANKETKSRACSQSNGRQRSSSMRPQKQTTAPENDAKTFIRCALKGEDKENSTRRKPSLAIKTQNLSMVSPSNQQPISALSDSSKIPFSPTHCYSPNAFSSNSQSSVQMSKLGSLPFGLSSTMNVKKSGKPSHLISPASTDRGIIDVE